MSCPSFLCFIADKIRICLQGAGGSAWRLGSSSCMFLVHHLLKRCLSVCLSLGLMATSTPTSPRPSAVTDSPPLSAAARSTPDGISTRVGDTPVLAAGPVASAFFSLLKPQMSFSPPELSRCSVCFTLLFLNICLRSEQPFKVPSTLIVHVSSTFSVPPT